MGKKYLKYIISVLFFLIISYLTFCTIFKNNNINNIISNLASINIIYIVIGIILIFLYFTLQGIYMKNTLKLLNVKISLIKGIFYSLIEFFFSGITPSSTGGQPVQLYYMKKDGISISKSLITLLINAIYFKLIIIIFGIIIFIFDYKLVFNMKLLFILFFFVGLIVDSIIVVGGYLILYNQKILSKLLKLYEKFKKLLRVHSKSNTEEKLEIYRQEIKYLNSHKKDMFVNFLIVFIQRICMFSMSYVVYRSFGLSSLSYFEIIILQITVQVAIEFIPLPGGTGVSEYLMTTFFISVFGQSIATTSMLLTRTFSFYIPLILSGIVILINYIFSVLKGRKKGKMEII